MKQRMIITKEKYTQELLRNDPYTIYLFGYNLIGKGKTGQACIRDENNAFGIPTKKLPSNSDAAFFTNDDLEEFKVIINDSLNVLHTMQKKSIRLPIGGLGTGLDRLAELAPLLYQYLLRELNSLFDIGMDTTDLTVIESLVYVPEKTEYQDIRQTKLINEMINKNVDNNHELIRLVISTLMHGGIVESLWVFEDTNSPKKDGLPLCKCVKFLLTNTTTTILSVEQEYTDLDAMCKNLPKHTEIILNSTREGCTYEYSD